MRKINTRVLIILLIMLGMYSAAVFALMLGLEKELNLSFWVAYATEVIAFVMQFVLFKSAYDGDMKDLRSKVLGYPVAKVGFVYLVVQTIVSTILILLGMVIDEFPAGITIAICVILLGGAAICGLLTDTARQIVREVDESTKPNTETMRMLKAQSTAICALTNDEETKKLLTKLAEKFRYSDPVSAAELRDLEDQLRVQMDELKTSLRMNSGDIAQQVRVIEQTLEERNQMCKAFK